MQGGFAGGGWGGGSGGWGEGGLWGVGGGVAGKEGGCVLRKVFEPRNDLLDIKTFLEICFIVWVEVYSTSYSD